MNSIVERIRAELARLESRVEAWESDMEDLRNKNDELESDVACSEDRLDEAQGEIEDLRDQIIEMKEEYFKITEEHKTFIEIIRRWADQPTWTAEQCIHWLEKQIKAGIR
jgi:chromosome segregation ATPase